MTTGGVFGTPWPAGGTRTGPGPRGPLLGVLTGELWLVAGEDTGEDSLLMEDAAGVIKKERETEKDETSEQSVSCSINKTANATTVRYDPAAPSLGNEKGCSTTMATNNTHRGPDGWP